MKLFQASVVLLLLLAAGAHAQTVAGKSAAVPVPGFPNKPIRIVVGFTPGGGPDITARYLAQKLTEEYKQQVIVDNRPGAGGTIAANLAATANPDGHTLLSVSSAHAVAPAIYEKLPYDAQRDLAGVSLSAVSKYVLVTSPSAGFRSTRELLAAAKARPGVLNFSSAGIGSGTHFAGELLKSMAKIDVVHIPMKGIPEAMTEAMTGRVQFFLAPIANAVPQVRDGKLLALGVSSLKRDALLPDVPTIADGGVPGYDAVLWFGVVTHGKTPRPIINDLNREIRRVLSEDETKRRWAPIGLEPAPGTPESFDKLIAAEITLFTKLARVGNIRAQ